MIVASRPIRLDKSAIRRLIDTLLKKLDRKLSRMDDDEPLGRMQIAKVPFKVEGTSGKDIQLVVVLRSKPSSSPFPVTGGGMGTLRATGKTAIVVELNGRYQVSFYKGSPDGSMLHDGLWNALLHELTHVADEYREKVEETTTHVKTEDELDPKWYYNQGSEVRAYMQEVVDQVLDVLPKFQKTFDDKTSLVYALKFSETWGEVKEHLTPRNKKKVLGAVWSAIQDVSSRAASRASEVKARRGE